MEIALYLGICASSILSIIFMITHPVTMDKLATAEAEVMDDYDLTLIKRQRFFTLAFLALSNTATISLWWLAYAQTYGN